MKKKILALMVCSVLLLSGGGSSTTYVDNNGVEKQAGFLPINDILVYESNTNIVYIDNYTYYGYHVYTPYYGGNGTLCKYNAETGSVEEIYVER